MPNTYLFHCRIQPGDFDEGWAAFFEQNRLTPEIYLNGEAIEKESEPIVRKIADWVKEKGLRPSVHAPLISDKPFLFDAVAAKQALGIADRAVEFAAQVNAPILVCHPILDKYRNKKSKWLKENVNFFSYIISQTGGSDIKIAVENIYEEGPRHIAELLDGIDSKHMKFCLDTGHFNRYSKTALSKWLGLLQDALCEIHLHDNHGRRDEHLPPGDGNFPFEKLVSLLKNLNRELVVTMEPLNKETATRTIEPVKRLFGL